MTMAQQGRRPVGELLRQWRERRRLSQLALALDAEISTRHLSFLAAQYHEIALRAEFGVPSCVDDEAAEAQPLWH